MTKKVKTILSKDLQQSMIRELSESWMSLCDDDRETVEDMVFNGFVGYNQLSDKEMVVDFFQTFIDGQEEEEGNEELVAMYQEAEAQLAIHGILLKETTDDH